MKYEFKFVKSVPGVDGVTRVDDLKDMLNGLGGEGYHLVGSFTEQGPAGPFKVFIMEREIGWV